jgi:phytoene synthase
LPFDIRHESPGKESIVRGAADVQSPYAHCEALVRAADKDRYLAGLYASAVKRQHLYALYAFAHEIAIVRDRTRDPMAGEIRLQWWREALAGERAGEALANPVAAALRVTIRDCALSTEPLLALIDAHAFDLYDEPMATLADLDRYAKRTSGTLFALGARILGEAEAGDTPAAALAGIAYSVTQAVSAFPRDVAHRRLFVPVSVLAQHGLTREDIEARRNVPALRAALVELRDHARAAFGELRAAAPALPESCAPAFLWAAPIPALLARLESAKDPFVPVELPAWRGQWAIWRAARKWPAL